MTCGIHIVHRHVLISTLKIWWNLVESACPPAPFDIPSSRRCRTAPGLSWRRCRVGWLQESPGACHWLRHHYPPNWSHRKSLSAEWVTQNSMSARTTSGCYCDCAVDFWFSRLSSNIWNKLYVSKISSGDRLPILVSRNPTFTGMWIKMVCSWRMAYEVSFKCSDQSSWKHVTWWHHHIMFMFLRYKKNLKKIPVMGQRKYADERFSFCTCPSTSAQAPGTLSFPRIQLWRASADWFQSICKRRNTMPLCLQYIQQCKALKYLDTTEFLKFTHSHWQFTASLGSLHNSKSRFLCRQVIIGAISFNLKKAFHTINHGILWTDATEEMESFSGIALSLSVENHESSPVCLSTGVCPLLFTLHINDRPSIRPKTR